jgi:adenylylsulfate kinase-like enzyme
MMNALKKTLAKMNSSDRARAIKRLRSRTTQSVEKGNRHINSHLSRVANTQQMSQSLNTQQLQVVNQAQIEQILTPDIKDFYNDKYTR